MAVRVVRIFVSSPNDAMAERRRVSRVVDRLNAILGDTARLEAVRWEERFYSAHDGFQPQIPRSGECDIVLAVLRGRIGSPLSTAFHEALPPEEQLAQGQRYLSGTAYEILTAIRARQEGRYGDSPDIYIFRWPTPPQVSLDAPDRADVEAQWAALKRFTEDVFLTAEGQFKGAYQTYAGLDDFEAQCEALLRDWLRRHVLGDRTVLWPPDRGSPFRGLEPFGMKHAAVFFGRTREIARAVDQLKASAAQGAPFQVVIGPSGAGKSSFLRAGLVPRLLAPGEVEGVGTWRMALMRPGEGGDGPVAALARRLFEPAGAIDPAEAGRPEALPELADGAFATPEALARQLAHADDTSVAPIRAALARVAEASQRAWGSERPEPARLLLLVDQLDEVFATAVTPEQRQGFARLLEALGRSGLVFVVTSLRAEFYEIFLKSPLAALAGDERTLTLKPPGLAEMAEIVREPARAADLDWEVDPATGERLDERLLADIDRPDLLPLLQFVLDRLYEKREGGGGEPTRLTFASYRALGTLDGAIRLEAERAFLALDAAEQAALPRLLRALVVPAQSSGAAETAAFALTPAPLAAAAPSDAGRRLVAALVDARLLSTGRADDGEATVSLAHQRVIEAWDRARAIVADSAAFQRVRAGVAARRRDWDAAGRTSDMLLPRGAFLAQAEEVAARYGDEIAPEDLGYLQASNRYAGRTLRRAYAAAALFAVIAVAAATAGVVAYQQRQQAEAQRRIAEAERVRAERNFTLARETVDRVISDVAGGLRNVEGMRIATVTRILDRVRTTMDQLTKAAPDEPKLQRSRAAMLIEFANTDYADGDAAAAGKAYDEAIAIDRALIARDPDAAASKRDLAAALERRGFLDLRAGDAEAARSAYGESIALARGLLAADPKNDPLRSIVAFETGKIAELKALAGDAAGARADLEASAAASREIAAADPGNDTWLYRLSGALNLLGLAKLQQGDVAGARASFGDSVAKARLLVERVPDNNAWQRELAFKLDDLALAEQQAHDLPGALASFEEALAMRRALVRRDPDNALWLADLPRSLDRVGDVKRLQGDDAAARADYDEALRIARGLAERDPENSGRQRDLSLALGRVGSLAQHAGDPTAAAAAFAEKLKVARALAARDGGNVLWQRDLMHALEHMAGVAARGDASAAQAYRAEAATIRDALAAIGKGGKGGKEGGRIADAAELSDGADRPDQGHPAGGEPSRVAAAPPAAPAPAKPLEKPLDKPPAEAAAEPTRPPGGADAARTINERPGAPAALEERVAAERARLARDPGDAALQGELALDLGRLGDTRLKAGDVAAALASREEAVALRRALLKRDPADDERLNGLASGVMALAEMQLRAGRTAAARAACEEALGLRRSLVARDPGNAALEGDLSLTLTRLGTLKQQAGDVAGALAAYDEALGLRRALVRRDPGNPRWQRALSVSLDRVGDMKRQAGDAAAARAAYREAADLRRTLPERTVQDGPR